MTEEFHIPVLCHKAVEFLLQNKIKNPVYVDGTLGGGGYTELICKMSPDARLICFDKDVQAISFSSKRLEKYKSRITFVNRSFAELDIVLSEKKLEKISGIVLDLGLSSFQLEEEAGFSFMKDTELDMRADKSSPLTAKKILNEYKEEQLCRVFEEYGEVLNPQKFVSAIVAPRSVNEFKTTFDLVKTADSIFSAKGKSRVKLLARIFQALRIEVNSELSDLKDILEQSLNRLEAGGRIVVVSYHSLEDRIVKNFFRENSKEEKISKYKDQNRRTSKLKIITKKPVVPDKDEISFNPKSRSAKLRVAERK